ncbi:hypothetical protein F4803DRAFT_511885 [Xylaria telfairii]|nr:hypothetical protein F4803DRAFT_511885 [Xylaria telfairii]
MFFSSWIALLVFRFHPSPSCALVSRTVERRFPANTSWSFAVLLSCQTLGDGEAGEIRVVDYSGSGLVRASLD